MVEAGAGHEVLLTGGHFLLHQDGLRLLTPSPAHEERMTAAATVPSVTKKPCPGILLPKEPTPREVSELRRKLKLGGESGVPQGPSHEAGGTRS